MRASDREAGARSEAEPSEDSEGLSASDREAGARSEPEASEDSIWEFWVDRGGTFTDCIARAPDGTLFSRKVLSSDGAAVEAVHGVLREHAGWTDEAPLPPIAVKLGTTVATNALLERRGERTALVTDRGLGDLLAIGTQDRPELFELAIRKPPPLPERVVEVSGRIDARGAEVEAFDEAAAQEALRGLREAGVRAVAIAVAHSYRESSREERLVALARDAGIPYVARSSEVAREIGLVARAETTVADAYLTPLLRAHVETLAEALPGARIRFMQSSGGLTDASRFRGPTALLSGPAGGVVGTQRVARAAGLEGAIGFDMGGTSTDVCVVRGRRMERVFESVVAGVRVKAPMLRIHTVAAGGGSLCRFDGFRLTVGPESAGSHPGPLCYGSEDARELALTDVNLFLGRIRGDRFPFPLHREPVERAFERLAETLREAGHRLDADGAAAGFVEIANASMAQAIQEVSVGRGVDPRRLALVGFGGAAGQHVCAVARRLGVRRVLLHPFAGLLSAWGIGLAEVTWDGQRDAGRVRLGEDGHAPAEVGALLDALEEEGREALGTEGLGGTAILTERILDLRYVGAETPLSVSEPADGDVARAFAEAHRTRFGYVRSGRGVEVVTARVRAHGPSTSFTAPRVPPGSGAEPEGEAEAWFPGAGRVRAPLYAREALGAGDRLDGPALVLEHTGTVVVDPGWHGVVDESGVLALEDTGEAGEAAVGAAAEADDLERADPVRLEVFGNRFMSIAEQMGAVLRNTAVSTNIKERLDYSCAVFDRDGGLVANAPHIPVHLGAMGATVRAVRAAFPDVGPGDALVTNDPSEGGSHLPDVTVVSPVFVEGALHFFVASRGHHADIGGTTPGSMPSDSTRLEEEGVVLRPFPFVRGGEVDEEGARRRLTEAPYPARSPDDNLADLEAMVAANRTGERLLQETVAEQGLRTVEVTMRQLQEAAGAKVGREIGRIPDGRHVFEDRLDDGTPVCVALTVEGERMRIDFAGTGAAVPGNLNAPRAVVESAVIYVLRCLVAERIPLNGGCLAPVTIAVPEGSLLDPPRGAAVVGGNVETSQRVVDVLLGALGEVAASQGTMNNVAFGDARFGYYETIGGGAGAGRGFAGASGVHVHMTNTRITDPEVLETRYPVRLERFALRRGSGGAGRWRGGDGLVRELRFTRPVTVSLLTERRTTAPFGLEGGADGAPGRNTVVRADGSAAEVPGHARLELAAGDLLRIETPGGGGFGTPEDDPA